MIEVGIDFPSANLIIIENANKFGLAQFINCEEELEEEVNNLLVFYFFKDGLSKNAIKRIKILKIQMMVFSLQKKILKLRGFGDIAGFQQSGIKNFRFADPINT